MAIAEQQRIQEDVSSAKRNLFCEVKLSSAGSPRSGQPTYCHSLDTNTGSACSSSSCNPSASAPQPRALLSSLKGSLLIAQICHKQYKSATEMETHLSSYDHHHKKVQWLLKNCPQ